MSKAVKKVFKGVKKVVKKVGSFVKKYWKEIVLAAAVVFTAGAALGYVGMGAGGGLVFGSANVAAASAAGVAQGVGAAWSALGNSVLGAVGIKGGGTGVFGQAGLGANSAAAQAAAAAQTAATGVAGSGLTPQAFYSATAGSSMPGAAAGAGGTVTGAAPGTSLAGSALTGGSVPVVGNAAPAVGNLLTAPGVPTVAKQGGGWLAKQTMGDWAQMAGVGMSAYGALKDDSEDVPDYALSGDYRYQAPPLMHRQPERSYRSTSASEQARYRYSHKITGKA